MKQIKGRKPFVILLSLVMIASMVMSSVAYVTSSDNPGKPDKQNPVTATGVELVKKVTVKMSGSPIVPPGQDKMSPGQDKKRVKGAATGILGTAVTGSRYAIVVGISDYPGDSNDLNYCDDDANEMYNALTEVYGFDPGNIVKLIDEEGTETAGLVATREAIIDAISALSSKVTAEDEVVFFFSGHGTKGVAEDWDKERMDEAICAHDGVDIVPIWDGELKACFSEFATSRIIFVFDTCLAGGMNKDLAAPGRVIAAATTEGGTSIEGDYWGGGHGQFSYYFVEEGMLQAYADTYDHDGNGGADDVTVEEAFDYAKANCGFASTPTICDYFANDLLL